MISTMSMSTVEMMDRFRILHEQAVSTYRFSNYLSPSYQLDSFNNNHKSTAFNDKHARNLSQLKTDWRDKLCAWMYQIVDDHELDRELIEVSLNYMDRYLSKQHINDSYEFQLVGMTSLYLAIKVFRHMGKGASISGFVMLSQGLYSSQDFETMEYSILEVLDWRMHPPTTLAFLDLLIMILPRGACSSLTRIALYERIKFLLELCVTVPFFFTKNPAHVAIAAFIDVMQHKDKPNIPEVKYQEHFCKFVYSVCGIDCKSDEVVECSKAMTIVHRNAWHDLKESNLFCGNEISPTTSITSNMVLK